MTNSDEYLRWLECTCPACKSLNAVCHDKQAWDAQLEESKSKCPNWSPDIYADAPADRRQQELFK